MVVLYHTINALLPFECIILVPRVNPYTILNIIHTFLIFRYVLEMKRISFYISNELTFKQIMYLKLAVSLNHDCL